MLKIYKDILTNEILGYEKLNQNSVVYKDDIVVEDYEYPAYVENNKKNLKKLNITKPTPVELLNEKDYLFDGLMRGEDLSTLKNAIVENRKQYEEYSTQLLVYQNQIQQMKDTFYLERQRKKDPINNLFYLTCVLLIKDENIYLKEWLDWHLPMFDHIYIYDNGEKENVASFINQLGYNYKAKTTIINWSGFYNNIQEDAYNHYLEHYKTETRWCIFLDSDEFLNNNTTENIKEILKKYEDYTEFYVELETYTANNQEYYVNQPVRKRFTKKTNVYDGVYIKNFIQVNRIDSFKHLWAFYNPVEHKVYKNLKSNKDLFTIAHYYTKSWEEWKKKIERGSCEPNYLKRLDEFFIINPDMLYLKEEIKGLKQEQGYQEK